MAQGMSIGRFDLEEHRKRLRNMNDEELLKHGKAARAMASDKNPLPVFVMQLNEARKEWCRKHPKEPC
jgi:hypothetical protein